MHYCERFLINIILCLVINIKSRLLIELIIFLIELNLKLFGLIMNYFLLYLFFYLNNSIFLKFFFKIKLD